jgi:hypothetical protein
MIVKQWYPKGLQPVIGGRGVVSRLSALRRELEAGAGRLSEIELPAVLLLFDVCNALGLSEAQQREVLGAEGARYIEALGRVPVMLTQTGVPRGQSGHSKQG